MSTNSSGPLELRPRLLVAIAFGVAVGLLAPDSLRGVTRLLLGWNGTVWLYLVLIGLMMRHPDHGHLRRQAAAHAEGALVVLIIVVAAAAASMAAIVAELGGAKAGGNADPAWLNMLLALATLVGSWLLLPVEFALTYASRYYAAGATPGGLGFPGMDDSAGPASAPHYADFLYFSLTIAATAQTSDVAVTTRAMRKLVVAHGVVSFAFNTMVLALAINMAASQF